MLPVALMTFRECYRKPFPYVTGILVVLLACISRLFLGFSFGAGAEEASSLATSAVFLAGLLHAAFFAARLVRADIDRGTLGLLLSKPLGIANYLLGRFLGAILSGLLLTAGVAACTALLFQLLQGAAEGPGEHAELGRILLDCSRGMLPVVLLQSCAIFLSAAVAGFAAPIALIGLFALGSLAEGTVLANIAPDFGLFGLDTRSRPPLALLGLYSALFSSFFLLLAYIVLASRPPVRSQT